jgi:hypothetical protein
MGAAAAHVLDLAVGDGGTRNGGTSGGGSVHAIDTGQLRERLAANLEGA